MCFVVCFWHLKGYSVFLPSVNSEGKSLVMKKPQFKMKEIKYSNPFKLKAQKEREQEYLQSGELVTPCRMLLVLVGE